MASTFDFYLHIDGTQVAYYRQTTAASCSAGSIGYHSPGSHGTYEFNVSTYSGYNYSYMTGYYKNSSGVWNSFSDTDDYHYSSYGLAGPVHVYWTTKSVTYNFILHYDANGGSGAPGNQSASTTLKSKVFTISSTSPTRSGYRFLGWSTSSSATSASYQPGDNITLTVTSGTSVTTTLYAVWEPIRNFILHYDGNGGSGEPGNQSYSGYTSSHTFTISSTEPVRSSYHFLGWSTSSSATSASYQPGDNITLTVTSGTSVTTTLYAVWEHDFSFVLHYDGNGGSGEPGNQSASSNTSKTHTFRISSTVPTRDSYKFLGWSEHSSAQLPSYQPDDTITLTVTSGSSVTTTLYAVWLRLYSIKFELRDPDDVITSHAEGLMYVGTKSYARGTEVELEPNTEVKLDAYSFDDHYHLVEWKDRNTGTVYSTENPYTFNITSDMNVTGLVDIYSQYTIDARRIVNETESVIFGDCYISVIITDSSGYKTVQKITTGGQYAYFYPTDTNIEVVFHLESSINYGQQFQYVTDTGTGTTYTDYSFTFTPGARNVMLHFAWIYKKLHVYGNFTPRANGYLQLTYYDSYPNGNIIATSKSSESDNASIWWDKQTYPNGVIYCSYEITSSQSEFSYWYITNNLSGYSYKYDDIHHYVKCLLGTSDEYGIDGYSEYQVQVNAVKSYTYVVNTIGGGDASAWILDSQGEKHSSYTFYEGETVNIGTSYDDTKYRFIHWVTSNMKDPSDIDLNNTSLSFIANDNHGREIDYETQIVLTAYYEGGGTECTISVSSLPEDAGDVMIDGSFVSSKTVTKGTEVELIAVPTTTTTFSSWSDGSTDNPHSVIVTSDMSLIAYFSTGTIDYGAIAILLAISKKKHKTMIMRRER